MHAAFLLHIRIVAGGVAIASLLAIDDRPAQAAGGQQLVVAGQILARPERERAILFVHRLVPIAFPGEQLLIAHALGDLDDLPGVFLGFARRIDELVPVLRPPLGVAEDSFPLDPRRGGQDQIGDGIVVGVG